MRRHMHPAAQHAATTGVETARRSAPTTYTAAQQMQQPRQQAVMLDQNHVAGAAATATRANYQHTDPTTPPNVGPHAHVWRMVTHKQPSKIEDGAAQPACTLLASAAWRSLHMCLLWAVCDCLPAAGLYMRHHGCRHQHTTRERTKVCSLVTRPTVGIPAPSQGGWTPALNTEH